MHRIAYSFLVYFLFVVALLFTQAAQAQCCSNGVNLLNGYNADFSAPFTTVPPGFTTDNMYSTWPGAGNYTIITSRSFGACSATPQLDHTSGNNTGKYLWFDTPGSATIATPAVAWEPFNASNPPSTQNLITVSPNTVYVFSVWIRDLGRMADCVGGGAPLMGLRINGIDMAQIDLGLVTSPCCPQWTYLCAEWNSGSAATALIQIESRRGNGFTDLGIDDVYFGTTATNFNGMLGNDTSICVGSVLQLQPNLPSATTMLWSDGSIGSSITVTTAGIYWLQATQNGCTGRDTIVVTQDAAPIVNLGNDQTLCTDSYTITPAVGGSNPLTYLWQNGTAGASLVANTDGVYWIQISNVCGVVRDSLILNFLSPAQLFSLGNDTIICTGNTIVLNPTPVVLGTYQWQDGTMGSSYTVSTAGTYALSVTSGCGTTADSVVVTERKLPTVTLGNDTTACGASLLLTSNASDALNYLWSNGATSSNITVTTSDAYTVSVTNDCGNASDDITVALVDNPVPPFNNALIDTCPDVVLQLNAQNVGMKYTWSTADTSQTIVVSAAGVYQVSISNDACVIADKITVNQNACSTCKIQVPTAFSPNGDKVNDLFKPILTCNVNFYELRIYNRWGELVFNTNDALQGWNGIYKGIEQPLGTYVYYTEMQFQNEAVKQARQGNVALLR